MKKREAIYVDEPGFLYRKIYNPFHFGLFIIGVDDDYRIRFFWRWEIKQWV